MSSPTCPTYNEVSDENCNQCILNPVCGIHNCKKACFDITDTNVCSYGEQFKMTSEFDLPNTGRTTRQVNIDPDNNNISSSSSSVPISRELKNV